MEQTDCPIAKKSLLAYLAGRLDGTGEGADFEAHVKVCDVCRALVGDRRKALQVLIASMDDEPAAPTLGSPLPGIKPGQVKVLALCSLIAIALIGVSYFVKPGSSLLGEKLGDILPPVQPRIATTTGPPPDTRVRIQEQTEETTAALTIEQPPESVETNEGADIPVAKKESAETTKPKPKPAQRKIPAPKQSQSQPTVNRVEVFDATGQKVGESIQPR
jgi:hypothetical protein